MLINPKDYSYFLPSELIANSPQTNRDHCRLMHLHRPSQKIKHHFFYDLVDLLVPGDVLVLNQSRVFPARLFGQKITGGRVEVLLCQQISSDSWVTLTSPGLKTGTQLNFSHDLVGIVLEKVTDGETLIQFNQSVPQIFSTLNQIGLTPIPPYIKPKDSEKKLRQFYQTVYAKEIGSAAAPTAGLHFTQKLLEDLKKKGIQIEYLTLHVGLGTFQPLHHKNLISKKLHLENFEINPQTATRLIEARKSGRRIIAVGTTTIRALESATSIVDSELSLTTGPQSTEIFIYPPFKFKIVNALITNFHLPESSLLMLVSAFAGREFILEVYRKAIKNKYHFFSFGDAMFIS